MHLEIKAAVAFLVKILSLKKRLSPRQLESLADNLACLLLDKYQGHWYPEKPERGQAYRCIRINPWQYVDECLLQASMLGGIEYSRLPLPEEMTLWIDPYEVSGRFGEHTDYFTIATFKKEVGVKEPIRKKSERETSDYSSDGPSSESVSESSSDDEMAGEKASIAKNKALSSQNTEKAPQGPQIYSMGSSKKEPPDSDTLIRNDINKNLDEDGPQQTTGGWYSQVYSKGDLRNCSK